MGMWILLPLPLVLCLLCHLHSCVRPLPALGQAPGSGEWPRKAGQDPALGGSVSGCCAGSLAQRLLALWELHFDRGHSTCAGSSGSPGHCLLHSLIHSFVGGWAMNTMEKVPALPEHAFCLKGGPASMQQLWLRREGVYRWKLPAFPRVHWHGLLPWSPLGLSRMQLEVRPPEPRAS